MPNVNPDTICKNCCFAEWQDLTQIGCKRKILDRYREIGATILDCYDEEKEFNVVQGRICPFFRTQLWKNSIKENMEERLELETRMGYLAIVFANKNLEDVKDTVSSLERQKLKPVEIRIIQEKGNMISPGQIVKATKDSKLLIRIESHTRIMPKEEAIHLAFKFTKHKCQFYSVFQAGYCLPNDFYSTINDYIVKGLGQFGVILPENEYNGLVIPESVHMYWYFHGDPKKTVLEQVKKWETQENQKICYTIQELRKKNLKVNQPMQNQK